MDEQQKKPRYKTAKVGRRVHRDRDYPPVQAGELDGSGPGANPESREEALAETIEQYRPALDNMAGGMKLIPIRDVIVKMIQTDPDRGAGYLKLAKEEALAQGDMGIYEIALADVELARTRTLEATAEGDQTHHL